MLFQISATWVGIALSSINGLKFRFGTKKILLEVPPKWPYNVGYELRGTLI